MEINLARNWLMTPESCARGYPAVSAWLPRIARFKGHWLYGLGVVYPLWGAIAWQPGTFFHAGMSTITPSFRDLNHFAYKGFSQAPNMRDHWCIPRQRSRASPIMRIPWVGKFSQAMLCIIRNQIGSCSGGYVSLTPHLSFSLSLFLLPRPRLSELGVSV